MFSKLLRWKRLTFLCAYLGTGLVILLASMPLDTVYAKARANASGQHKLSDNNFDPYVPIFTKAQVKIAETAGSGFTSKLFANAVDYEPLLLSPRTQVHMGFWSGPGNHGSLARLLDSINSG